MVVLRRITLWAIPVALVGALAWSLATRSGSRTDGPPPSGAAAQDHVHAAGPSGGPPPSAPPQSSRRSSGPLPSSPSPPNGGNGGDASGGASGETPGGAIHLGNLVDTDAAGHRRWQITADDVSMAQGGQAVRLTRVHAVFYDRDGSAMTVTAQQGAYDTRTKDVTLTGDVHGVSSNGRQIFADELDYSAAVQRVTGVGHIRVVEERVVMYADRMVSDTRLGQTQFFGHVHMTVR